MSQVVLRQVGDEINDRKFEVQWTTHAQYWLQAIHREFDGQAWASKDTQVSLALGRSNVAVQGLHPEGASVLSKDLSKNGWWDFGREPDGVPARQGCTGGRRGRGEDVAVHAVQDGPLCGGHHAQPQGGRVQKEMDAKRERSFGELGNL